MPDPVTTAIVVSLLTQFLAKTGDAFAEKAGDALFQKASSLYQTIKNKFTGDEYAELTLLRLEESPEAKGRQVSFENLLAEKIDEDSAFANRIAELLEDAKKADTRNVIAYGERSVAIGGDVSNSNITTGDTKES